MLEPWLWGRPRIAWALDLGVVVLAVALLTLGNPTLRALAVLMLLWRLVSVVLAVVVWRRTSEGRSRR